MTESTSRRRFLRQVAAGTATVSTSLALAACGSDGDAAPIAVSFAHGVASGDPLADRVILWTRATPESESSLTLDWEVAADDQFKTVVRSGTVSTDSGRDYTAKVDVTGLKANTVYWYRFVSGDTQSPIGRTKTLPVGSVEEVRLAVFSCSNYPAGYFHVYGHAATLKNLDAAIHLGDYIYEYAKGGYADAANLGRESEPVNELVRLADYRLRYAQYRTDPDLQALHAALPIIAVWDDHEVANDTWLEGAENHQPDTEGDFGLRKAAAVRAYHEWLPTREQSPLDVIYRSFDFGNLLSLHMLDTRVVARDRQLSYGDYLAGLLGSPDPAAGLTQFLQDFAADAGEDGRQLMGAKQLKWLEGRMTASSAQWQVLGQQVLMAPIHIPMPVLLGLLEAAGQLPGVTLPAQLKTDPVTYLTLLGRKQAGDPTLSPEQLFLLSLPAIPYNLDSWDGYWAERERVLAMASKLDKNLVVLAGDTHNAWASNLIDMAGNAVGVEFATSSVTSPGFEATLGGGFTPAQLAQVLIALANLNTLPAQNKWAGSLKYADVSQRGYLVLTATQAEMSSKWYFVDTILELDYQAKEDRTLTVLPGAGKITQAAV